MTSTSGSDCTPYVCPICLQPMDIDRALRIKLTVNARSIGRRPEGWSVPAWESEIFVPDFTRTGYPCYMCGQQSFLLQMLHRTDFAYLGERNPERPTPEMLLVMVIEALRTVYDELAGQNDAELRPRALSHLLLIVKSSADSWNQLCLEEIYSRLRELAAVE